MHRATHIRPAVRLNKAWLITWMDTEPWARPDDWRSIMAIISGNRSEKFIKEVVWLLDVRAKKSAYHMAYYANRRQQYGLPVHFGAGLRLSGSNAWLYARIVTNLSVTNDGVNETLQWVEPDYYRNNSDTYQIELVGQVRHRAVTRSAEEKIGGEPYHRWIERINLEKRLGRSS